MFFGGVDFTFRKFYKYLEGFVLRSKMSDFKKCVRKGGQVDVAGGSLEDWRVFRRSLDHSELLRKSFKSYWISYLMLILTLEASKS